MDVLLKNGAIFTKNGFRKQDVLISDGKLHFNFNLEKDFTTYDCEGLFIIPGFCDVHVHFREPGFSYKETIRTGTEAAAHGGYTAVCAMPNLKPVPSNLENLQEELDAIERDALIHVYPYAAITKDQSGRGELGDMEALAPYICAFTDDGKGVQDGETMKEAMRRAKALNRMVVAHCEDEAELKEGGCIHDGEYARLHNHIGINSASEWKHVARDIELARETGVHYHICHVSTKESVELIRKAKAEGVNVTAETGPHYLMYTDMDLEEDGKWRMNPPIRSFSDREALIQGLKDGTIDCIITDHAPHSKEEKSRGLDGSAFGIVGLETSFPSLYHNLVLRNPLLFGGPEAEERARKEGKRALRVDQAALDSVNDAEKVDANRLDSLLSTSQGVLSFYELISLMSVKPREVFDIPGPRYIEDGEICDIALLDLKPIYQVDTSKFYSMGKSTLFDGMEVQGEVVRTYVGGELVYDREQGICEV